MLNFLYYGNIHTSCISNRQICFRATVRVGEYDSKGDPDCTKTFCAHPAQEIPVSHVLVHPGFERKIFKHDVAMLVLKEAINYSGIFSSLYYLTVSTVVEE